MNTQGNRGPAAPVRKLIAVFASAAVLAGPAMAEDAADYPSRPIEFIVQSSAGSSSDTFARELAKAAEPILGQTVAIDYKPGGGGANQMGYISHARPDGYTIGVNTLTHFSNMAGVLKGMFKPDDFTWIAMVQTEPHIYAVRADAPYDTFAEFAAAAAERGEAATVGGYGPIGSTTNIAADMGLDAADVTYNWVSFNASSEAITALLGGHVEVVSLTPSNALEYRDAGRVKILGVIAGERNPVIPDVPTLGEQGYEIDTSWQQIRGVYGPAGIPGDIRDKLAAALQEAARSDGFQQYMDRAGISSNIIGSEEYTALGAQLSRIAEKALDSAGLN
ncbi:Bug family tripartite tricarboxylate transporter substrate binding protein [Mangrovicoccus ximenensis]|uniref:Bug family tripartite tricarboxylate transporter substrate binding protein n=1 Tax=Mangrovicoccus ximenensis TaxID=1911570 RepID=UPI000D3ACC1B|nr:tripartite tricarboxylate transporter substrate binding protein [Mangrovicoccus ximenensis]